MLSTSLIQLKMSILAYRFSIAQKCKDLGQLLYYHLLNNVCNYSAPLAALQRVMRSILSLGR